MKFWMVASISDAQNNRLPGGCGPRVMHQSLESAEREAERLALKSLGYEFAILECVSVVWAKTATYGERPLVVPCYARPAS